MPEARIAVRKESSRPCLPGSIPDKRRKVGRPAKGVGKKKNVENLTDEIGLMRYAQEFEESVHPVKSVMNYKWHIQHPHRILLRMEEAVKAKLGYLATRPAAGEESTDRRRIGSIAASMKNDYKEKIIEMLCT